MKYILSILFIACIAFNTDAQTYVSKGKIEFEKQVSSMKVLEDAMKGEENSAWMEMYRKSVPKTTNTYFDLYFNTDKSLYRTGREVVATQKAPDWINGQANDNVVFNDLSKQTTTSQKNVFENTYLVQDSLRNLNWKITNDTRVIAGFECRRATAVMMDSVFVVAFFTEQILCTSGPEGFNGLPGMILGVAIPRLHTTWYATKLELTELKESEFTAPKKGKPVNSAKMHQDLKKVLEGNGGRADRMLWQITI